MKKITIKTLMLSFAMMLIMITPSLAQELLYEVPFSSQIQSSSQIVEGKVISKTSFWDDNNHNIYTLNTIEVYKIFKGQTTIETIEVVTPGGSVGDEFEVVTPSLSLEVGNIGVFMLHDNTISITNGNTQNKFQPVASSQGFYKYDIESNIVRNPFQAKQGITDVFYNDIISVTNNSSVIEVSDFNVDEQFQDNTINGDTAGAINISNFTPTTLNGGVRDLLTINGAGFGATQGTVGFRDANFGGADAMGPVYFTALDSQVVSWSDTQIVVEVPSRAGTGDIRVTSLSNGNVVSSQTLTVFYSQINPANSTNAFPSQHFDINGSGGYTWQMHTDFDFNAPAKASFLRAFDTWVCTTGMNWEIGAVTPIDVIADDDINIIRFDNGTELPEGVLGRATSRFGSCGSTSPGGIDVVVTELDIVFNDVFTGSLSSLSWEFGPGSATGLEIDFESVAVHELGHAHQLAHIISPGAVMHYTIANAQNSRNLGASDLDGGNDVMDRNVNDQVCGTALMTYSACSTLSIDENSIADNISIYPNPVKNNLHISRASSIVLEDATIYDMRGRLILSKQLENNTLNTIDVSPLNTGVYFIKINVDNATISKKFIVE